MFILNKYNSQIHLFFNNSDSLKEFSSKKNNINYIFMHKSKFIRNFIFFYSSFLITNQFSFINQKNQPNYVVNLNLIYLMFVNLDYNNFFFKQ